MASCSRRVVGVERERARLGVGHTERFQHDGESFADGARQSTEAGADAPATGRRTLAGDEGEEAPQQVGQRAAGQRSAVRRAVGFGDDEPFGAPAVDRLLAEPALADARRADDGDHLTVARHGVTEGRLETCDLVRPADERREPARAGRLDAGADGAGAGEREGAHGPADALHADRADGLEAEEGRDQRRRVRRDVDRAGARDLLHAGRQADGVSLRGVVHAEVVADRPHDHLAGVEPHAHGEAQLAGAAQLLREAAQLLADMERRVAGPLRVVLVRDRGAEQRHDAVAGELVDGPLEAVDAVGEDGEEPVEDAVPLLGTDAGGEAHRLLHVGEEDRHLLALALDAAPRGEDLLHEMVGRVRGWLRHRFPGGGGSSILRRAGSIRTRRIPDVTTRWAAHGPVRPCRCCRACGCARRSRCGWRSRPRPSARRG